MLVTRQELLLKIIAPKGKNGLVICLGARFQNTLKGYPEIPLYYTKKMIVFPVTTIQEQQKKKRDESELEDYL